MSRKLPQIADEYCSECCTEQEITHVADKCPNPECDAILLACGMCDNPSQDGNGCIGCDYDTGSKFVLHRDCTTP